jgi:hypothetical protein
MKIRFLRGLATNAILIGLVVFSIAVNTWYYRTFP